MASTPIVVPDKSIRRAAERDLERTFAAIDEHARAAGITGEEAEAAIDEAMRQARRALKTTE